jgi:hypothetical protein
MEEKENDYVLIEEYNKIREKYRSLPDFDSISEDFDIEKLFEKETDFILREARRIISEKVSAYMHFFEAIINPTSPPLFIFSVLKGIDKTNKIKIENIYKRLAKFQIESMKLDTIYSEEKEAAHIEYVFGQWQSLKKEIYGVIEMLEINIDDIKENKRSNYFG